MNNRTGHSTVTLLTTIAKGVKFVEPQQFAKDFDNSMTVGASISVVQIGQIADPALTLNLNQVSGRDIDEPTIRTLSGVIIDPYNSDVVHLPLSTNLLIGLLTQISSLSGRDLVQAATNLNDAFYYLAATTSSRQAHFGKAGSVLGDVRWIGFDKDKETGVKLKVSKKPIKGGIEVMTTDVVSFGETKGMMIRTARTGVLGIMFSGKEAVAITGNRDKKEITLHPLVVSRGDDDRPVFSYDDNADSRSIEKTADIRTALSQVGELPESSIEILGHTLLDFQATAGSDTSDSHNVRKTGTDRR